MTKKYYVSESIELESIKSLPYMLRLMMAAQAFRSAIRWTMTLHKNSASPTFSTDLLMSFVAAAGWCGGAIKLLKEGVSGHIIEREMLNNCQSELIQAWDECIGNRPSEMLTKIYRARDKHFAHWDEEVVQAFVAQADPVDRREAFVECSDEDNDLETNFPWAYMVICRDLFPKSADEGELREFIEKATETMGRVSHLIDYLMGKLVARENLSFRIVKS
ncbi:MAG: hypothetical protein IID37_16010 [Planctomycetes bacterium]|nr:hypothetical protein [Planctomycetota bacterium]